MGNGSRKAVPGGPAHTGRYSNLAEHMDQRKRLFRSSEKDRSRGEGAVDSLWVLPKGEEVQAEVASHSGAGALESGQCEAVKQFSM